LERDDHNFHGIAWVIHVKDKDRRAPSRLKNSRQNSNYKTGKKGLAFFPKKRKKGKKGRP